jgi:hypothetical protein
VRRWEEKGKKTISTTSRVRSLKDFYACGPQAVKSGI